MENYMILIYAIAVVAFVFLGIALLIPYLIKKGINISGILTATGNTLDIADHVLDGVQQIFPSVPALGIVDLIIDYADKAVEAAEQMYLASKIESDERKEAATDIVYDLLAIAGIDITDDVKRAVDGLIEGAVFSLPKTHLPEELPA